MASFESARVEIDYASAAHDKDMEFVFSCRKILDEMTQKVTFARQKVQKQLEEADQSKADASLPDDVPF